MVSQYEFIVMRMESYYHDDECLHKVNIGSKPVDAMDMTNPELDRVNNIENG